MVQTPVGARCPGCARLYKLPTYRVSTKHYLRAVGTALGMAIIGGIAWGLIDSLIPFFFLSLLLAPAVGYAIGEVVSLATNRKRGRGLATIAGIAVAVSYLINILFLGGLPFGLFNILLSLLALALGIYVAANRLR